MDYSSMSPRDVRQLIREGKVTCNTSGMCAGYAQANLCVLPKDLAYDFLLFAQRNPRPCPILEVSDVGSRFLKKIAPGADIANDIPKYRVYENGIMTGSDKKLNPGAAITRQEFAAVLQRTMKLFAENGLAEIVPGDGMAVYEFTDSSRIQNWAISPVSFCIKNHLMQGDNRNAFNPTGNVNRAQVAKALSNIAAAAKK